MRPTRRALMTMSAAAVAAPMLLRLRSAKAAEVTLRLHHFLPPKSNVHARLLDPWTKKVAELSGGKVAIEIFPSMQLGGKPPELYDQAKDGVADIVWTLPGYTPGRFPRTEVFELPFIASPKGIVNAKASQDYADTHLAEETKGVKLLSFWSHDAGVIHCRDKIEILADLQGKKLRFPTRLAGEALKAVGVAAVGMPVPQVPESLAQGVLDGAVVPWEVVPAIKLHELVKFHTEIPGTPTFYTASFFLAMNPAKYEGLPEDVAQGDRRDHRHGVRDRGRQGLGPGRRRCPQDGAGQGQHHPHLERGRQGGLDDGLRAHHRSLGDRDEGQEHRRARADRIRRRACLPNTRAPDSVSRFSDAGGSWPAGALFWLTPSLHG